MGTFSLPLPLEALLFKLICSNPLQEDPFIMAGDKPSTEHVELASPLDKSSVLQREYTVDEDGKKPLEAFDYSGAHEKTDPKEIALVKKLDWYIMPMLWIMYWLNYLDRNAIALARLDDLEEDLNLTSTQYQTCVSILFVGYISSKCLPTCFSLVCGPPVTWPVSWLSGQSSAH